jgi:glycosyltransferase involved in cell wall biosynthesis
MRFAMKDREGVVTEAPPEKVLPARPAYPRYQARTRPHICFVAPHAWPVFSGDPKIQVVGGAEVQQSVLARVFAANGYRVSMICLDYGQPDRSRVDGVTVHKTFAPQAGVPVLRFLHPRLTSTWRKLGEVDADIYYCRAASIWLWLTTEFARRRGRRAIYAGASDRDFDPDVGGQLRYARDRWLYRRGLAAADRIVAQNHAQRASCAATHGRDATVIPSCYQLPAQSADAAKDRVLWVAAIHETKRPEMLLQLAARLPQRRFVMIGGPRQGSHALFERMRVQAAALPNVEFKGFLPLAQVEPWFDRARVFVNTSAYEGMPNTFLQAWARGVPTVATVDVGAPVHCIANDVESLARGVEAAFENPALGARCRAYFERTHSTTAALDCYARLFDQLA